MPGDGAGRSWITGAAISRPERLHPDGDFTLRHSMALFNLHLVRKFLWGGEIETLAGGGISTLAGDRRRAEQGRGNPWGRWP